MTTGLKHDVIVRELPADLKLSQGDHRAGSEMCLMEAVAFAAGEDWSDAPACVSPVIRRIGIRLNDRWSDENRQRLVPYIARVIGTTGTPEQERRRVFVAMDWLTHDALPAAFRQVGAEVAATEIEQIPPVTDEPTFAAARQAINGLYASARERRCAALAKLEKMLFPAAAAAAVEAAAEAAAAAVAAEAAAVAAAAAAVEAAAVAVEAAAEAAAAAAAVAVAAAAAEAAAAVAVEINRALAGEAGSRAPWIDAVAALVKERTANLPKDADCWQIRAAIYWPVRELVAKLYQTGELEMAAPWATYHAGRIDAALQLLDRLIAVAPGPLSGVGLDVSLVGVEG